MYYVHYIHYISIVKLATLVEGDSKAPFSIATTSRCREGHYSFPWIHYISCIYFPFNPNPNLARAG